MTKPIAWTIAGSDCCSGAGIQADLATFQAFEVYGCNVVTAVTSQNALGVQAVDFISEQTISAQINSLYSNLKPAAIKIGMLGSIAAAESILKFIKTVNIAVIFDPVLYSSFKQSLVKDPIKNFITMIKDFFPFVTLFTPNIPEAEIILNRKIQNKEDIQYAAREFIRLGCKNVLIKGGHVKDGLYSKDYWTDGDTECWVTTIKIANKNVHGTGCILSAAITAALVKGYPIKDAITIGKYYVTYAIETSQQFGEGTNFVVHKNWLNINTEFPKISAQTYINDTAFPDCGCEPLGLYPVVDHVNWLERLLPLGVKTIQLRIKNQTDLFIKEQIKQSVRLAKVFNARLFINDYWQWAAEYGAYGVHLGQEDLLTADINIIQNAGLRLGISSHSYFELATALFYKPSYIALGPIFATTTKKMQWAPQGISTLRHWRKLVQDCQLVAIGGIDLTNLSDILKTKVDGFAVVSAILKDINPLKKTLDFISFSSSFSTSFNEFFLEFPNGFSPFNKGGIKGGFYSA